MKSRSTLQLSFVSDLASAHQGLPIPSMSSLPFRHFFASTPTALRPAALLVSEIFTSIQGEGPFSGRPSVFLRLAHCNLSCSWCDTPYTWLFSKQLQQTIHRRASLFTQSRVYDRRKEVHRFSLDELSHRLRHAAGEHVRAVVITGGEPLLQKRHLKSVVDDLIVNGFNVEFETNGTVSPLGLSHKVHLNVSPKLSNSHQPSERRINVDVLKQCVAFDSAVLKFVVGEPQDLKEVASIVEQVGVARVRVFLMPLGTVSHCHHLLTSRLLIHDRQSWVPSNRTRHLRSYPCCCCVPCSMLNVFSP